MSDAIDAKIQNFEEVILASEHAANFDNDVIIDLTYSLKINNLLKISIRGSASSIRLEDKHIICLTEAIIKSNIQLVDLSLPYHKITDVGFEEIARLLQPGLFADSRLNSQHLEGLDLEGNDISGSCFPNTSLVTSYDCPLVYLNLSCNPLSKDGRMALSEIILKNRTLRQLSVNSCGFDLVTMISLITNLYKNNTLQLLYMDRPFLQTTKEDEISDHVGRVLVQSHSLYDISFRYCNILNHGAKLLSDALCVNGNLLNLNLECNKIGVHGAEALASYLMIRKTDSIKSLGLSYNFVGDDGAIALAEAIKVNTSLINLSLKNNSINPTGLQALGDALQLNNTLESISIFGNNFSNDNGRQYLDFIQNRLPYTGIYLDIDVYVVDGLYKIAEN